MGTDFNADEVLAMAERIERNGQGFYLQASRVVDRADVSKLLADLGVWEKGHEALFIDMRSKLSEEERRQTAIDPYNEAALYLAAVADSHVFSREDLDPAGMLREGISTGEIIDLALQFEKDSILFFLGLQRMVPESLGMNKVQKIIDEEVSHMAFLEKMRRELAVE